MRISRFLAVIAATAALAGTANAETAAPKAGSLAIPKIIVLNPSHTEPAATAPAAAAPANDEAPVATPPAATAAAEPPPAPHTATETAPPATAPATTPPAAAAPAATAAGAPAKTAAAAPGGHAPGVSDDDLLDPTKGTGEAPPSSAAPAAAAETPGAGDAAPQAAAPPPPPPEPTLVIDIDLTSQRMTVAENGALKYTWPVSSARYGYRTPTGTFQPTWMSKMWYSRQYDYARMPNAIFFHNGTAIHATNEVRLLGRPASHGCVRLALKNSATLYKMVSQHGKELTKIVVHGNPGHPNKEIAGYDRYDNDYYRSVYGPRGYPRGNAYTYGDYYGPPPRGYYSYSYPPRGYDPYRGGRPRYVQRGFNGGYRYGYGF